jgi:4-hydroxy-2-oxoglutarate aldolase
MPPIAPDLVSWGEEKQHLDVVIRRGQDISPGTSSTYLFSMDSTPDTSCSCSLAGDVGHHATGSVPGQRLPNGVYVPMIAFFQPETKGAQQIDIAATQRHAARLLQTGVRGLVIHGSNGEAVHLSRAERSQILSAVADTVRHEAAEHDHGHHIPLIAGCSAASVAETVELCSEAYAAGASHALVLPPGYYRSLLNADAIVRFYADVSEASPIPVMIYNFPAAANGVDLDSDILVRIASTCPRVIGVKLTCGNTGKLARVVAQTAKVRDDFFVGGGSADFILQGLAVGAHGTVSGFANLAPRACVRIGELWESGRFEEARELQGQVAGADWLAIRYGFPGVKAAMPMFWGEGERGATTMRRPFEAFGEESKEVAEIRAGMAELIDVEEALAKRQSAAS